MSAAAVRRVRRQSPDVFVHVAVGAPTLREEDMSPTFFDVLPLTSRGDWEASFLVLEAWRLVAYDRVAVVAVGALLTQNLDEAFGCPREMVFGTPSSQAALGLSLLVLSPSLDVYKDMLEVAAAGQFDVDKGWDGRGCGYGMNGAMQIEEQRKRGRKTVTFQTHQGDYTLFRRSPRDNDQPYLHDFSQPICLFVHFFLRIYDSDYEFFQHV